MEMNTVPTSAYIAAPGAMVYDYLCDLRNLDEWTLYSRMREQMDEDTWLGTASGYQRGLYYHLERIAQEPFLGIEWHCGFEYKKYFQIYPVFLIPPGYIEPGSDEPGVYFHWVSFVDPARRTELIRQVITTAHAAEARSLKGVLERRAGLVEWAESRYVVKSFSIYVDAPMELGAEHLGDVRNLTGWQHLRRDRGEVGQTEGAFTDEYGRKLTVSVRSHVRPNQIIIEEDTRYPEQEFLQRAPLLLMPCSYVFGEPEARGFVLQRFTFWKRDARPRFGKVQEDDYRAELMNAKRVIEAKAGNLDTFARGLSYLPRK
jgi:hypothetical protein